LKTGTPLRPLFAAKSVPQTLPQSCAGLRFDCLNRKGHRAFLFIGVGFAGKVEQ
jgi:hypothetical protein